MLCPNKWTDLRINNNTQYCNTVILYAVTDDNKSVNSSVEMSLYVCGDISAEQRVWGDRNFPVGSQSKLVFRRHCLQVSTAEMIII